MNTNCLENISCPQCGNDSDLKIGVKGLAHVTDDGAETFGDLEWDDQSFAAYPVCGKEGKLGEFRRSSPEEAPPGIPLTTFHVHLYREMRLFFPGIEAPSTEVAAFWASRKSTDEAALIDDWDGETLAALVDVAGDETFEQSRVITFDLAREAARDLVTALGNLCAQIEGAYGDIDLSEANAALSKARGEGAPASTMEAGSMNAKSAAPMSNTVTIVIDGGHVQSVYATDSTMRVIVLDLDIEGSDPDDPRIFMDHAAVQEHVIESYQVMPHEERKTLEKFLLSRESIVIERKTFMKPYSVLLLYPDTGNDPETYYAHTESENPDAAIAKARAESEAANLGIQGEDFLPLIVLPGHIEAELFYRDVVPW